MKKIISFPDYSLKKSKITNERQLVIKDFLERLNPERISKGMKAISPAFISMKMRFMTVQEMKTFFGECNFSKSFGASWWSRLRTKPKLDKMPAKVYTQYVNNK